MTHKKKNNYSTPGFSFRQGWVLQEPQKAAFGKGYTQQMYEEDVIANNYSIFDDKQIKEVLKGIENKQQLHNPSQVHEHGARIVPIFCKKGYGVNYVKEQLQQYSQLTPDRYKTIIKAVIRKGIRVLQDKIQNKDANTKNRQKMTNTQYNAIVTPLIHSQTKMPTQYRLIFYKLLKYAYGVGPSITREEGKKLYSKLKLAAYDKDAFFLLDDLPQSDQVQNKFVLYGMESIDKELITSTHDKAEGREKNKKKKRHQSSMDDDQMYASTKHKAKKINDGNQNLRNQSYQYSFSSEEESSSLQPFQDPFDPNYHANRYWASKYSMPEQKAKKKWRGYDYYQQKNSKSKSKKLKDNEFLKNKFKEYQRTQCSESETQSVPELVWPDEVQFLLYELLIDKFNYKQCCERLIQAYPQNSDYFTVLQVQKFVESNVSKLFREIGQKYFKISVAHSTANDEQTMDSKTISLFLLLKTHHQKIYRFLMRSNYTKQPRKYLLKIHLTRMIQTANPERTNLYKQSVNLENNQILALEKLLNASFNKKITADTVKQIQFNGDYDEALETQTNDFQFRGSETYRFRASNKKFLNKKVNFEQEEKDFLSIAEKDQFYKPDLYNDKSSVFNPDDPQKDFEAYLRQPVKQSIPKGFDEEDLPPKPFPRSRRSRPKKDEKLNRRAGSQRATTNGRTYKTIMKKKPDDILQQFSDREQFPDHDEYDWFHNQQSYLSTSQSRYGVISNDYGYDNRAVASSLNVKGYISGVKNAIEGGQIVKEGQQSGGIIQID